MGKREQGDGVVCPPRLIGGDMKAWKGVTYMEDVLWRQRRRNGND